MKHTLVALPAVLPQGTGTIDVTDACLLDVSLSSQIV